MSIITWKTEDVISAVHGYMHTNSNWNVFNRITIDSRLILANDLFVAINGENYKGIDFFDEVLKKGATGIIIEKKDVDKLCYRKLKRGNITCIIVQNTIQAIGDLAAFHRKRINAKVVAITGSIGKTTTNQILANISIQKKITLSTSGNMNNQIGLPLTLLKVEDQHRIVLLELGMSKLGEIRNLSKICQPDIAVITNIAPTHLATLGSIHNILKAKAEIIEHIKPDGTLILNFDDPSLIKLSKTRGLKSISFASKNKADVKAENISITSKGICFLLKMPSKHIEIHLSTPSQSLLENTLASSAAAFSLNFTSKEIKAGIESFEPDFGRMKSIKTKIKGVEIIDDTYNSNPVSLQRALETISLLKNKRFSIAIIGDMLELGKQSKLMHLRAGALIAQSGTDKLYAIGTFAKELVEGAILNGMPINKTYIGNRQNIINDLERHLQKNCILLIKGSRGMKMELFVSRILKICNNISTLKND